MFLQNDAIGDFLDALYDRQIGRAGMEQIRFLSTHSLREAAGSVGVTIQPHGSCNCAA